MINEVARHYALEGLTATPAILTHLIDPVTAEIWDRRVDPERFTLREVLAHLADWEPIWMERLERMHAEKEPLLPDLDEGERAKQKDYAHADVGNSLKRFRQGELPH